MDDDERRGSDPAEPADGSSAPEPPRYEPPADRPPRYEPPAIQPPPAGEPPAFQVPPTYQPPAGPPPMMEPPYSFDSSGQEAPYGTPSYPAAGYGGPGQGVAYGMPHPGWDGRTAEASSLRTQAIVSLVLNLLAVVCCNLLGIAGAVCAGSALGKIDLELDRARSLVRWSWGLLAAGLVLAVIGFAAIIAVGALDSTQIP